MNTHDIDIELPPLPRPSPLREHRSDYSAGEMQAYATAAFNMALASPEVQALRDALQEVVDAADGEGWDVLDASLEKQRAALAAMEKL